MSKEKGCPLRTECIAYSPGKYNTSPILKSGFKFYCESVEQKELEKSEVCPMYNLYKENSKQLENILKKLRESGALTDAKSKGYVSKTLPEKISEIHGNVILGKPSDEENHGSFFNEHYQNP